MHITGENLTNSNILFAVVTQGKYSARTCVHNAGATHFYRNIQWKNARAEKMFQINESVFTQGGAETQQTDLTASSFLLTLSHAHAHTHTHTRIDLTFVNVTSALSLSSHQYADVTSASRLVVTLFTWHRCFCLYWVCRLS